jgi:1,4-dihydroxy-2-naphthoate polyprenyltransferase
MLFSKKENQTSLNTHGDPSPFSLSSWLIAARPKTWIAAISPVAIGLSLCHNINLITALLTLLFALCIQVGTNLSNDYMDFIKGSDTHERKGPLRACQSGLLSTKQVRFAAMLCFAAAFLIGLSYWIQTYDWFIPTMLVTSIALGYLYTATSFSLSYLGIADPFVFLFFGPLAAMGTYYLQTSVFSLLAFVSGIGPGLISCAILMVNNIRDVEEDRKADKNTIVVRLGVTKAKIMYGIQLVLASCIPMILVLFSLYPTAFSLIATLVFPALILFKKIWPMPSTKVMNDMLAKTALFLWVFTIEHLLFFYLCR